MIYYLDANIVMYFIENRPLWGPQVIARINTLQSKGDLLAISDLTRMECRVGPLKSGNVSLLKEFDAFFAADGVRIISMTASVFDRAAVIRAIHRFRPMDALHLAAAIESRCDRFLTNDARLAGFPEIVIESLP